MTEDDGLLIRYLLDDLSADQRGDVEQRLARDASLAKRLETLRECFNSRDFDSATPIATPAGDAPPHLADRTADAVRAWSEPGDEAFGEGRRFSLSQVAAIGVAALLVGSLITPALQASRAASQRLACENNFAELGKALLSYAGDHNQRLPPIGPLDNAGVFAVALADGGYLDRRTLERRLVCPSSPLAEHIKSGRAAVFVPTRAQLQVASPLVLERMRWFMGGSVAYRLGHLTHQRYRPTVCTFSTRSALLADAPRRDLNNALVSQNHGGCGQNVLFEDGHVEFLSSCWSPTLEDHIFLNDVGQVAAGRRAGDIVLAPSHATPGVSTILNVRIQSRR